MVTEDEDEDGEGFETVDLTEVVLDEVLARELNCGFDDLVDGETSLGCSRLGAGEEVDCPFTADSNESIKLPSSDLTTTGSDPLHSIVRTISLESGETLFWALLQFVSDTTRDALTHLGGQFGL